MSRGFIRQSAVAALLAASVVTGCGDDEGDSGSDKPGELSVTLVQDGTKGRFTAPKSVEAGLVNIRFKNRSRDDAGLQLIRVEGGHTVAQAIKAGAAWGEKDQALPDWIRLEGGTQNVPAGKSASSTQVLQPGTYGVLDRDSNVSFEVIGEGGGELPDAPGTVEASEYSFSATGLKRGVNDLLIANQGREPHIMVGLPINPGSTIADVRRFLTIEKGKPPFSEKEAVSTPILDGGAQQVVNINLKKSGSWALVCYIPDRKGGPAHTAKGMISEVQVR